MKKGIFLLSCARLCGACTKSNVQYKGACLYSSIDYSDVLSERSEFQKQKIKGTEISIRFDSDFDSARILEEYETSFPEDINGATQYLRARAATYYTRKKLQIISEYGLSFDNLEELEVPFNFLGYYYPGMMTLDQIQYSIQKNNLQHLPDKGFSIMVLYDDIEASLD